MMGAECHSKLAARAVETGLRRREVAVRMAATGRWRWVLGARRRCAFQG